MLSLHGHNHLRNVYVEFCHRAHLPGVRVESGSTITPDLSRTQLADVLVLDWERGNTSTGRAAYVWCTAKMDMVGRTQMVVQQWLYNFTTVAEERRVSVNYVIAGVNSKDSVQMSCKLLAGI